MLEIYAENSSKGSLFLRLVPRRVPIPLMTHLVAHPVAHLATHQLGILAERPPEMPLFPRLGHLLEPPLVVHLSPHPLSPHLVAHLLEPFLVTRLEALLVAHLLSRVYP